MCQRKAFCVRFRDEAATAPRIIATSIQVIVPDRVMFEASISSNPLKATSRS